MALQYVPFEGQFTNKHRWLSIFLFGLECTFRRWFTILLLVVAWLSAILKSVNFFIMSQGQMITREQLESQGPRFFTQTLLGVCELQILWLALLLVFVGAGLISNDLKNGAYQLYFARPIQKKDYILGKACVVFFYSFLVLWLPMLIIWAHCFLFSGFHSSPNWQLVAPDITWLRFAQSMFYLVIITFSMGLILLTLSSLTKNAKFVGLIFIGIFFLGKFLEQIASFLKVKILALTSYLGDLYLIGRLVFDLLESIPGIFGKIEPAEAMIALCLVVCISLVCLGILYRRIRHIVYFGQ